MVFDSAGAFVGDLGRAGNGPGEFRAFGGVAIGIGDTILAEDGPSALNVFSPERRFVRRVVLPAPLGPPLALSSGSLVFSRQLPSRERVGFRFHILNADSLVARSFALDSSRLFPGVRHEGTLVTGAAGGRFWSVYQAHYELELWDTTGVRQRLLRRVPPTWWEQWKAASPASGATGPPRLPSAVQALHVDSAGVIWVAVRLQAPDWKTPARTELDREQSTASTPFHEMFDTVLEGIDPAAGALITSEPLPFYVFALLSGGLFATYEEDFAGVPRVHLWKYQLVGRE